jgi:hypothetical protein
MGFCLIWSGNWRLKLVPRVQDLRKSGHVLFNIDV